MTPHNYGAIIRRAAIKAGFTRSVSKLNKAGQPKRHVEKSGFTTHDLRHTYAVWTYLLLRSKGDTNPWIYVQAQLGHRSSETTINIYLRAVRMFENEISDIFAEFITSLTSIVEGGDDESF